MTDLTECIAHRPIAVLILINRHPFPQVGPLDRKSEHHTGIGAAEHQHQRCCKLGVRKVLSELATLSG